MMSSGSLNRASVSPQISSTSLPYIALDDEEEVKVKRGEETREPTAHLPHSGSRSIRLPATGSQLRKEASAVIFGSYDGWWLTRVLNRLCKPISPERRVWNFVVFVFVLYNTTVLPLRFAFHDWAHSQAESWFLFADYCGDLVFILDIFLNFFTPYNEEGFFVTDLARIRAHYVRGWFAIDLVASLPLGFIAFRPVWKHAVLRSPRILRMLKYDKYFKIWEHYAAGYEHLLRFSKLLMWLVLVFHWLGCAYIATGYWRGFASSTWLPGADVETASLSSQYITGFFWAANIVTGEGGAVARPTNDFERGVTVTIAFISVFVISIIIGNVAELIAQGSKQKVAFQREMAQLNLFMNNRQLPHDLQVRIRQYFVNVLRRRGTLDDTSILDELPASLRAQATHYMNKDIISKADIFQRFSTGFTNQLVTFLRPQIFSPGDYLVLQDEVGSEMFFIQRGSVNVIVDGEVLAQLGPGQFFGEIALVQENCRRTASVQAVTFCHLYCLTRDDLQHAFRSYPEEKRTMRHIALYRHGQDNLRQVLARDPSFANEPACTNAFLARLTMAFKESMLSQGDVVFKETDIADRFYYVAQGSVELLKPPEDEEKHGPESIELSPSVQPSLSRPSSRRRTGRLRKRMRDAIGQEMDMHLAYTRMARLETGAFFGGIGILSFRALLSAAKGQRGTPYAVRARVPTGETRTTMLLYLDEGAHDEIVNEFPEARAALREFVRKYRSFTMVAKQRFLDLLRKHDRSLPPLVGPELRMFLEENGSRVPESLEPDPKHPEKPPDHLLFQRLWGLRGEELHKELEHMTPGELLVASEILRSLISRFSRALWRKQTPPDRNEDDE